MVYITSGSGPGGGGGITWVQEPLPGMTRREITELGVMQVQNGIVSIDEVREKLDLPPWGTQETSEPVVFTEKGPVPMSVWAQNARDAQRIAELEDRVTKLEQAIELMEEVARLRRELKL